MGGQNNKFGATSGYFTKVYAHCASQRSTYRQLFERGLQLLVVGGGGSVDDLLLASGGALAADAHLGLELLQLLRIHAGAVKQIRVS